MDLATISTTIPLVLVALSAIATFVQRRQRAQRAENRKLRAVVLAYDTWTYEAERRAAARGFRLPAKPNLLTQLEDPDDEQLPDPSDHPDDTNQLPEDRQPDPVPDRPRHARR